MFGGPICPLKTKTIVTSITNKISTQASKNQEENGYIVNLTNHSLLLHT
jgi:hypothetical protein